MDSVSSEEDNNIAKTLGIQLVSIFIAIILATYFWTKEYNNNEINRSSLKIQQMTAENAQILYKSINSDSHLWEQYFNIDIQISAKNNINELKKNISVLKDNDLGGVDIMAAFNKNNQYWIILQNQLLQLHLLKNESDSLFYKFLNSIKDTKEKSSSLDLVISLPERHSQILEHNKAGVISSIKRDIALISKEYPRLNSAGNDYVAILDSIQTIKSGFSKAIEKPNSERNNREFDLPTLIDSALHQTKALQKQLNKKQNNSYFIIIFVSTILFSLAVFCIILSNRKETQIKIHNKIESFQLNKKLILSEDNQKAKTNFLSIVSYEARSTLDAVLGFTRLAKNSSTNQGQISKLDEVINTSIKLNTLLDDVLNFIDIEIGAVNLQIEPFSPSAALKVLTDRYTLLADEKHITLEIDIDPSLENIYLGDQRKFHNIFDCLLSNSLRYTDKGHITLTVSLDSADSLISDSDRVNITIEDTGIGLSKEESEALFNPYSAAMFKSSRKSGGSGIRLSTASRLIDMMDGEIDIESLSGHGVKFTFYLHLEHADPGQEPITTESILNEKKDNKEHLDLQHLSILVVEDNISNSTLITWILEDLGHQVIVAENGIECLNLLESNDFDLIFMDQHMPEMDGEEATLKIRARNDYKADIPIIGCTADAFQETRDTLISAGQNDIILKPISDDVLVEITQKFLHGAYLKPSDSEES